MSRTQNKSLMSLNKYTTLIITYTIYIRITQLQLTYINIFFKTIIKFGFWHNVITRHALFTIQLNLFTIVTNT